MATTPANLNPEPSVPEERSEQGLPPKSYAKATTEPFEKQQQENENSASTNLDPNAASSVSEERPEQSLIPESHTNSTTEPSEEQRQGKEAESGGSAKLNPEPSVPEERSEQGLPPKSYAKATAEPFETQQQENQHATVVNGDAKQDQSGPQSQSKSKASSKPGAKSDGKQSQKRQQDQDKVVFEKHTNSNGEVLTSVKPSKIYEESLKHDASTAPRDNRNGAKNTEKRQDAPNEELSSGREAGSGWEQSAIRWAPLNVPLQRRLQTLAVLGHTLAPAGGLSLFFLLCAIPLTWPLLVPYLIFILLFDNASTSGSLSRRSQWLRSWKHWSSFASYFPARLHRTVELEPTRKYIFGYHPHGIISHGAFAAFGTEALGFSDLFPGITNTLLTLDSNFRIPLYRDYILAMGLASVSRESIENLLSRGGRNGQGMGRAVTIVVGGARESLDAKPGQLRLVLRSRKGFVKLAIRQGADLVPVLSFGENELYDQVDKKEHPWVHKWQLLVKKFMGFTIPLFHARGIFNYDVGLQPYRRAMNIVVGRPIRVVQQGLKDNDVDPEYLDQVHAEYMDELLRLWDSYKDTFAKDRTSELEVTD